MAKKAYVGVNNIARNVKAIYVGVNGVARKVVKGYIGVNGVARQFFGAGAPVSVAGFWFFYKPLADELVNSKYLNNGTNYNVVSYNGQDGIVFYAFVSGGYSRNSYWYDCIVISTDPDALDLYFKMNGGSAIPYDDGGVFLYNNEYWYWQAAVVGKYDHEAVYPNDYSPDCFLNGNAYYDVESDLYDYEGFIQDVFLPRIYTDDFIEDYQVNETYDLQTSNIEKTIRKVIAIGLYKNIAFRNQLSYQKFLESIDTIVNGLLSVSGSYTIASVRMSGGGTYSDSMFIDVIYTDDSPDDALVSSKTVGEGYTYCYTEKTYTKKKARRYYIQNGVLNYVDDSSSYFSPYIGVFITTLNGFKDIMLSNLGLNFVGMIKKATHSATQYLTANIIQPVYIDEELYTYVSQKGTSNSTEVRFVNLNSSSSVVYKVLLMMWNYEHTYKQFQPLYISENPFSIRIIYYRNDVLQSDTVENAVAKTRHGKTYYVRQVAGFMSTALYSCNLDLEKFTECTIYNPTTDISQWEASYIVFDGTIS